MGADMRSGQFELHGRRACGLVSLWCSEYDHREEMTHDEWMDTLGVFDYSNTVVAVADLAVPMCYEDAKNNNFPVVDQITFSTARLFLQDAATTGEGISGSY